LWCSIVLVGEFDHGIRQGQGTCTFGLGGFEGEKFVGEFQEDDLWTGTMYDASGNIIEVVPEVNFS